jgi:tetratricopeptide (TPR) repeat protein
MRCSLYLQMLFIDSSLILGLMACSSPTVGQRSTVSSLSSKASSSTESAQNIYTQAYDSESLQTYQEMLKLSQELKDRKMEGMALVGLGSIFLYQENFTQAITYLESGLKIVQVESDRLSEKRALMNLSVAYANIGQGAKALPYAQALLKIAEKDNDVPLQAVALQGIGASQASQGNFPQAIPAYEKSLKLFQQVGDGEREAIVLSALGEAHTAIGDSAKGIAYQEQSGVIAKKASRNSTGTPDNRADEADKLLAIQPGDTWEVVVGKAISARQLGKIDAAIAAFARYGEMFKASDPSAEQYSQVAQEFTRQIRSLNVKGGVYIHQLVPNGSAAQGRLAIGDIIIQYNGRPVSTMPEFIAVRDRVPQGKMLEVVYLRLEGKQFRRYTQMVNNPMGAGLMPI